MSAGPEIARSAGADGAAAGIAGLVLAAGESSRMGTDKALLAYRGRTFLETVISTLHEASLRRVVVVLGHHAEDIQRALKLEGSEVVINQEYRRGQASSLQAGLRALENHDFQAIVLCLVDHPKISPAIVRHLIAAWRGSGSLVVIPTFEGRRGHPVLISRALFDDLRRLGSDQGADTVIRKYRHATQCVEVSDPGILIDVDDPDAYRALG